MKLPLGVIVHGRFVHRDLNSTGYLSASKVQDIEVFMQTTIIGFAIIGAVILCLIIWLFVEKCQDRRKARKEEIFEVMEARDMQKRDIGLVPCPMVNRAPTELATDNQVPPRKPFVCPLTPTRKETKIKAPTRPRRTQSDRRTTPEIPSRCPEAIRRAYNPSLSLALSSHPVTPRQIKPACSNTTLRETFGLSLSQNQPSTEEESSSESFALPCNGLAPTPLRRKHMRINHSNPPHSPIQSPFSAETFLLSKSGLTENSVGGEEGRSAESLVFCYQPASLESPRPEIGEERVECMERWFGREGASGSEYSLEYEAET